ncbi:MAG: L-threonylcarbamoyladenylate synthase [Solirubrobacterales bacterium]
MNTLYLKADPEHPDPEIMDQAASFLAAGELVAFPTETVYGLGARADIEAAVERIFAAKERPPENPLIIHVNGWAMARSYLADYPPEVEKLVEAFWPGPLTIVARAARHVPAAVRAGGPNVGVRMPSHPVALALIEHAGVGVAAPSANLSGRPSPTSPTHVRQDLDGRIAVILDGGTTGFGIESTVLDVTEKPFRVLRSGAISLEQLDAVLPRFFSTEILRQPPQYQPQAVVYVFDHPKLLLPVLDEAVQTGKRIGVAFFSDFTLPVPAALEIRCSGLEDYAARLFEILRAADEQNLDQLFLEIPEPTGLGRAIADRVLKAAAGQRLG